MLNYLPTLLVFIAFLVFIVYTIFSDKKKRIQFLSDCGKGITFENLVNKYGLSYAFDNYPKYVLTIIGSTSIKMSADLNAKEIEK